MTKRSAIFQNILKMCLLYDNGVILDSDWATFCQSNMATLYSKLANL